MSQYVSQWRVRFHRLLADWDERAGPEVVDESGRGILTQRVGHPGQRDVVCERNAYLASAAPEFLEVSERVLSWMEKLPPVYTDIEAVPIAYILADLRSAIKKAKGDLCQQDYLAAVATE